MDLLSSTESDQVHKLFFVTYADKLINLALFPFSIFWGSIHFLGLLTKLDDFTFDRKDELGQESTIPKRPGVLSGEAVSITISTSKCNWSRG